MGDSPNFKILIQRIEILTLTIAEKYSMHKFLYMVSIGDNTSLSHDKNLWTSLSTSQKFLKETFSKKTFANQFLVKDCASSP